MQYGQYELTLLSYLQRQRQSDQDWYAQWDNQPVPDERRFRLLRLITRRLRAEKPQALSANDARHAHAI